MTRIEIRPRRVTRKLKEFFGEKSLAAGIVILVIYCVVALLVPIMIDENPGNLMDALQPPSAEHPFGTDEVGRDLMLRVFEGCRMDLVIALAGVGFAYILALPFGLCAGYFGGN